MAIYDGTTSPRLCFGITGNAGETRQFDLYFKT